MVITNDFILTIIGSGGDGVIAAGEILLSASAKEGLYGFLLKSFGPQIRGGESSIKLRISNKEFFTQGDFTNVLLVYNWADFSRFKTEYDMAENGFVISDSDDPLNPFEQSLPWKEKNLKNIQIPIAKLTKEKTGSSVAKNIFSLGILAEMFNLPFTGLQEAIKSRFSKKSEAIISANINALAFGQDWVKEAKLDIDLKFEFHKGTPKIVISGNEAISLAALNQGLEFYASYPITPATEILQFLSVNLPKLGGSIVQAEDEMSAINMAIGASFAGRKSMTGTSGPGMSLKAEAIGLASMVEVPLVVVNIQRGGPSTGIPTKFEQADLLQSMYLTHGDAPKVVIAPTSAEDSYVCTNYAFQVAEKYQLPVIILSDQFIGHRDVAINPFKLDRFEIINREKPLENEENYKRYKLTDSGVSKMAIPGQKGVIYQTNGLEHNEYGRPSSDLDLHQIMSEKRERKMQNIEKEFGHLIFKSDNKDAKMGVIAWGSSKGSVMEAVELLQKEGININYIIPRLIYPFPKDNIQNFLNGVDKLVIVEMSFSGQFHTYLKSQVDLPKNTFAYHRAGGKPFNVSEIYNVLKKEYTK